MKYKTLSAAIGATVTLSLAGLAQDQVGGQFRDPVDDRRLRQVFSTSIGVRNRLP